MKINKVIHGDSFEIIKTYKDNTFHAIITDPPYGISFMDINWDRSAIAFNISFWAECLRVLKPGGYLLSFSAATTYHKMAGAIESAGFEIRDTIPYYYDENEDINNFINTLSDEQQFMFYNIMERQANTGMFNWVYAQGMPKGIMFSSDKSEYANWKGYSTALKPANEPICVARKPLSRNVAWNLLEHGTGAINIDKGRIKRKKNDRFKYGVTEERESKNGNNGVNNKLSSKGYTPHEQGRYPSNVIFNENIIPLLEMQKKNVNRFFYCPKTTKKEKRIEERLLKIREDISEEKLEYLYNELDKYNIVTYDDISEVS